MSWVFLSLFSALFATARRTYEKNLTKKFGNFTMGFIVQAFSLIPTLILFLFFPVPHTLFDSSWQFWWPLLIIWFVLYPIQTYFMYRALREGDLSDVTPIAAVLPVFNTFSSWIIIGEQPSLIQFGGIFLVTIAVYMLLKTNDSVKINRPVLFMLLATFCIGIGTTLDKISILASTPVFYSFMNSLGASIIFLVLMYVYKQDKEITDIKYNFLPFTVLGVFQALSYTATMFAFTYTQTNYVLAVKSSSFLFTALVGIFYLKEKFTKRKCIAFVLFVLGVSIITLM